MPYSQKDTKTVTTIAVTYYNVLTAERVKTGCAQRMKRDKSQTKSSEEFKVN